MALNAELLGKAYPPLHYEVGREKLREFAVDHRLMAGASLRAEGFSIHDEGRMLHARADDGRELAVVFDDKGRMAGVTALA